MDEKITESELWNAKIEARQLCDKIARLIIEYENRHHNTLGVMALTVSRMGFENGSTAYDVGVTLELSASAIVRNDNGNSVG